MNMKELIANIGTICTLLFKIFIFGSVLIVYQLLGLAWFWYILMIITGSVWVLGLQNIMIIYHLFKKE
jgi:hypothetical protein